MVSRLKMMNVVRKQPDRKVKRKGKNLEEPTDGEEAVPKELRRDLSLPVEVWIHAWNFLDFNTRQKICTLVSKTWLNQIRNSSILSGEMKIFRSYTKMFEEFENADAALSRWKKLKVLHVTTEKEIQGFGNFSEHKLLEKIVVWDQDSPGNKLKSKELGSWVRVTKSWFNPKHQLNPATLENVVAININLENIPSNFEIEQMAQRMKNLKNLKIYSLPHMEDQERSRAIGFISSFKNLKNVQFHMNCPLQDLIATLNYLATLNLKISGQIHVRRSHEQDRNIFEEAVQILNKKFAGKCERFGIYGVNMSIRIVDWGSNLLQFHLFESP